MASTSSRQETLKQLETYIADLLSRQRNIRLSLSNDDHFPSVLAHLRKIIDSLRHQSHALEADAFEQVYDKVVRSPEYNGLGIDENTNLSEAQIEEIQFQCNAWIESVKSKENSQDFLTTASTRRPDTRPMTLAQKIFLQHALGSSVIKTLAVGDVCRVGCDWIIASELSWSGMARTYQEMGSPGIWRNDRLWIAGDHVVHPDIADHPKVRTYIETAERAKRDLQMTEFQGFNYTIMHTEFVRERAEPGMLVIGSDSHTCSAGAVGSLAVGLGTADVMMTLALGETWFKIPESVLIEFVGEPAFGMSGKDVILHILKQLKRNTVAAERIVEFAGPGAKHLSTDARFAICNMCTEFGAVTGLFVPDEVTREYVERRRQKNYKSSSLYFKPDADAQYASRHQINLSAVESTVAIYPNPDDVVPVSQMSGTPLDGVFIGACTTTEEELVLAALVLKVGLAKGLPLAKGQRHYVPGSLPIVQRLQELGLLEIYEEAGFTRGPPGCSMCVGISAEKASEGETWLSSQNRNFRNRMGKGAFGHVSSAMVCAASAFSMKVTSPAEFLDSIDKDFFYRYKNSAIKQNTAVQYVEPKPPAQSGLPNDSPPADSIDDIEPIGVIESRVVTLPDFIDTDALAPGTALTTCVTDEDFGQHLLEHTHPEFRSKVSSGQRVVVAGKGFGVGSSREVAVSALKGAGVQAVIAKSFAFIYSRNQPALGLLGIVMEDEQFFVAAQEGEQITVDVPRRVVRIAGKEFPFVLSDMEYRLTAHRGVANAYNRFGKTLWRTMMKGIDEEKPDSGAQKRTNPTDDRLQW